MPSSDCGAGRMERRRWHGIPAATPPRQRLSQPANDADTPIRRRVKTDAADRAVFQFPAADCPSPLVTHPTSSQEPPCAGASFIRRYLLSRAGCLAFRPDAAAELRAAGTGRRLAPPRGPTRRQLGDAPVTVLTRRVPRAASERSPGGMSSLAGPEPDERFPQRGGPSPRRCRARIRHTLLTPRTSCRSWRADSHISLARSADAIPSASGRPAGTPETTVRPASDWKAIRPACPVQRPRRAAGARCRAGPLSRHISEVGRLWLRRRGVSKSCGPGRN